MIEVLKNLNFTVVLTWLIRAVLVLICITFHELAHGFTAYKLGDNTAKDQGRLTLNPIRHIDIFGLIMMLVAGFGWAKPVPVNPNNFRRPKLGMALTALAGPLANLILAVVVLALGGLVCGIFKISAIPEMVYTVYFSFVALSVGLALFNLIPIPPLDGSKVLFALLPDSVYSKILRYERFGFILLFALVYLGSLSTYLGNAIYSVTKFLAAYIFDPIYYLF